MMAGKRSIRYSLMSSREEHIDLSLTVPLNLYLDRKAVSEFTYNSGADNEIKNSMIMISGDWDVTLRYKTVSDTGSKIQHRMTIPKQDCMRLGRSLHNIDKVKYFTEKDGKLTPKSIGGDLVHIARYKGRFDQYVFFPAVDVDLDENTIPLVGVINQKQDMMFYMSFELLQDLSELLRNTISIDGIAIAALKVFIQLGGVL